MANAKVKKPRLRKRPVPAIHRVNKALESSVVDVLRGLVPEVKALPRKGALEMILDDIGLLARCFMAYREDPESFRHLLVDNDKQHVLTSDQILSCGRSFDDVVSLLVRTSAKRYLRSELDGRSRALMAQSKYLSPDEMTAVQKMLAVFGKQYERDMTWSKGREIYDALQENLLFDWQVPLVPEYATLTPESVIQLGPKILDYKVSSEVRKFKEDPANPPPPSPLKPKPLFVPPQVAVEKPAAAAAGDQAQDGRTASVTGTERVGGMAQLVAVETTSLPTDRRARLEDILTVDGRRLKASAFSIMLLDPKVRAVLPDATAAVRVSATLGLVGGQVAKLIVGTLGLRPDQIAVLLIGAHNALGEEAFIQLFGVNGRMDAIQRMVDRASAGGINQDTPLEQIADLARRGFAPSPQVTAEKTIGSLSK